MINVLKIAQIQACGNNPTTNTVSGDCISH